MGRDKYKDYDDKKYNEKRKINFAKKTLQIVALNEIGRVEMGGNAGKVLES